MGRGLAWIGVLLFAISWFVPVVKGQELLGAGADAVRSLGDDAGGDSGLKITGGPNPGAMGGPSWLHGWPAFRFAWDALTGETPDMKGEAWKGKVLGATCLTNGLMLVSILLLLGQRGGNPLFALLMLGAVALNASWIYFSDDEFRSLLSTGYYLWAGSFLLVGLGMLGGRDRGALHPA